MTSYLVDVNALIALIDPHHVHHARAHEWFRREGSDDWISVPMTENGVLRIVSHPRYANSQPLGIVMDSLQSACRVGGHRFEPDSISLLDEGRGTLISSREVTDTYLLAMSAHLDARLATFDRKLVTSGVPGGAGVRHLIP